MAGRISRLFIDDLLSRTNLVGLIDQRVRLKKAGKNYQACCPFHNEKSPSFTVNDGNDTVSYAFCHSFKEARDTKTGETVLNMSPKDAMSLGIFWKGKQNLTVPVDDYSRICYLVNQQVNNAQNVVVY